MGAVTNPFVKAVQVDRQGKLVTITCTSPKTASTLFERVIEEMEQAQEDAAWAKQKRALAGTPPEIRRRW